MGVEGGGRVCKLGGQSSGDSECRAGAARAGEEGTKPHGVEQQPPFPHGLLLTLSYLKREQGGIFWL